MQTCSSTLVLIGSLFTLVAACSESSTDTPTPPSTAGTAGASAGSSTGGGGAAAGASAGNATGGASTAGASSVGGAGAPNAGGGAGGSAGASGAGGSGGGSASGLCSAGDCSDFSGGVDGYLFQYPCAPGGGCKGQMCVNNALTVTKEFTFKGDAAKVYEVTLHVRGVTESKNYAGGTRRSTMSIDPGPAGGDLWYEGGTVPLSSYGSYELHVKPPVTGAPNDYYLNARDGTDEHDGTTWVSNYTAKVSVHGGGTITFRHFDSNCDAIRNCGAKGTSPCTPRTLDLADAVPAFTVKQPIVDANMTPPQWLHLDVTGVREL